MEEPTLPAIKDGKEAEETPEEKKAKAKAAADAKKEELRKKAEADERKRVKESDPLGRAKNILIGSPKVLADLSMSLGELKEKKTKILSPPAFFGSTS